MSSKENTIRLLRSFMDRDKFSDAAWQERGLNPSSSDISSKLNAFMNATAEALLIQIQEDASEKQLRKILRAQVKKVNKADYDTEEIEFVADLFHEMGQIINIEFGEDLNSWMYGRALTTFMKIKSALNPVKIIETIAQPCSECSTPLEIKILQKEKEIPDSNWMIVQCNKCKAFSLLSQGPGVKQMRFEGFHVVEWLDKNEFSFQQAATRLEQIRYFRTLR